MTGGGAYIFKNSMGAPKITRSSPARCTRYSKNNHAEPLIYDFVLIFVFNIYYVHSFIRSFVGVSSGFLFFQTNTNCFLSKSNQSNKKLGPAILTKQVNIFNLYFIFLFFMLTLCRNKDCINYVKQLLWLIFGSQRMHSYELVYILECSVTSNSFELGTRPAYWYRRG